MPTTNFGIGWWNKSSDQWIGIDDLDDRDWDPRGLTGDLDDQYWIGIGDLDDRYWIPSEWIW